MPTHTVTIERVQSWGKFWEIDGVTDDRHFYRFTTNKPWAASLADRAKTQHKPVTIGWRDTARYGRDVVTIQLAEVA